MHRGKGMKFVGDSRIPIKEQKNIPKDYSEYPGKTEAFLPNFLLKEWMVGAVFLIGFLSMTIAEAPPLEKEADPSDSTYIPLPDWYFLFLYQLLKYQYVSGDYVVLGTVVIPGLAFGALLLAPWLDRGVERRPSKRPIATSLMLLGVVASVYLTWESVVTHDWEATEGQGEITEGGASDSEEIAIDQEAEGYQIATEQTCTSCHGDNLQNGSNGPSLVGTGLSADEIADIAQNGTGQMPAGVFNGSEEELQVLSEYLAGLGNDGGEGGE